MEALRAALKQYLMAEEACSSRSCAASRTTALYSRAWERYRSLLARAVENATISSYGRHYPGIFWLHHSLDVARLLKETPKRILRQDLEPGRRHGDQISYRVFDRYRPRLRHLRRGAGSADATEEVEEDLFPRLLTRMRDNVLIFTEDHISRDLASSPATSTAACASTAGTCASGWRARWHAEQLETDRELREAVAHLLRGDSGPRRELLNRPGYVAFLATRRAYNPARACRRRWCSLGEPAGQAQGVRALHGAAAGPAGRGAGRRTRLPRRPRRARRPAGEVASSPPPGRSTSWSPGWSTRESTASG